MTESLVSKVWSFCNVLKNAVLGVHLNFKEGTTWIQKTT